MDVTIDWAFADARVPGRPVSTIAGSGIVGATRDSGLTFTNFEVRRSDVDLRTVRRLAPAVIIEGRLAAAGTLDGPLKNVTFRGTARQQDGDRPPSTATGTVHLDTRPGLARRSRPTSSSTRSRSTGIRRAFPTLKTKGELRGRFQSEGTLSRLAVDADLTGDLGDVQAAGIRHRCCRRAGAPTGCCSGSRGSISPPSPAATLPTSLAGELRATGSIDTAARARGHASSWRSPGAASASGPSTASSAGAACTTA